MKDSIKIEGTLKLIGKDKNGKILWVKQERNLITDAGFDFICDVIGKDPQPARIAYMAIGDGVAGDETATTLTSEVDRQPATYAHTDGTKVCTFTATFDDVAGVKEYGLFNNSSGGTMLNISSFASITVDELQIQATLTLS